MSDKKNKKQADANAKKIADQLARKDEEPVKKPVEKPMPKKIKVALDNFEIMGVSIKAGFSLNKSLIENEKFMKRFNRAIEIGVIKWQ